MSDINVASDASYPNDNSCMCFDFKLNELTGEYYCKTCNKLEPSGFNDQLNINNAPGTLDCIIL